jgi:Na+/H+-dicarboxylate symporter
MFIGSTLIAVSIGTALAVTLAPGKGVHFTGGQIAQAPPPPQIKSLLISLVPSNPFEALAQGNMLQVICCGLLACAALALAGESGKNLERLCLDVREALMQLVVLMMRAAPFGVLALSTLSFANLGRGGITSLLGYMLVHVLGLLIQFFVVYGLALALLARLNPRGFFRKMREVHVVAFSTDSSGATMPTTLRVVEKNLGVSRGIAAFVIPLGVSVNKDGSAVLHSVGAVFLAQVFGIQLHASQYILIASMSVLSSLGTVGVPGTGIIMLAMVLSQAGIPLEGIGLLLGVDRLLDMLRTVVNVTGHSVASCVIAASEKQIDRTAYLAKA